MSFMFVKVEDCDLEQYKKDMQEAFQKGFQEDFGKTEEIILPEDDINRSLTTKGSVAYKAVVDDEMVGGAVVVIDEETQHKYKYGNRHFWAEGYYVSTVGLNEATVRKYIQEQEKYDIMQDKLSVKEYEDPFKG